MQKYGTHARSARIYRTVSLRDVAPVFFLNIFCFQYTSSFAFLLHCLILCAKQMAICSQAKSKVFLLIGAWCVQASASDVEKKVRSKSLALGN